MNNRKNIELLAPAGDADCFKAAIAAGADAIFFGLEQFSARTRAKNLTIQEASYLIPIAHKNNCRAYLTLNTLLKDSELTSAVKLVKEAIDCGIDAVIVQDFGVLSILHTLFPTLELHASTQMTTHNSAQCEYLSTLGISQINLSRELSLDEIKPITKLLHDHNIIPEIFVQGAFCISYSGQCYLSGNLYGEPGNRGSCVQPCRRNWCIDTIKNPSQKDFKPCFHLKDNSAYPIAKQLIEDNIPLSLKIEGRIKNAEYVWAVTSAWREQIDRILNNKPILNTSSKLTGAINRDYTCGYLEGSISSNMFSTGTKDVSLEKTGIINAYRADTKTLTLQNDTKTNLLSSGDQLKIKDAKDNFICTAKVIEPLQKGYKIQITNKLLKKILPGQIIYKSTSVITPEKLNSIISKIDSSSENINKNLDSKKLIPLNIKVKACLDQKLQVTYTTDSDHSVTVESQSILEKSNNSGITKETLEEKLTKLGGTIFTKNSIHFDDFNPNLFIPLGELNNLRRQAISFLTDEINKLNEDNPVNLTLPLLKSENINIKEPKEAWFISTNDYHDFLLKNNHNINLILELPSVINTLSENMINLIQNNPQTILYTNSIFLDDDFDSMLSFILSLDGLKNRTIICDNTGLAYKLSSKCNVILGPNTNITNSYNLSLYKKSLKLKGIIPSLELSPSSIDLIQFPNDIELWYPKSFYVQLMQSRQCLTKNSTNCRNMIFNRTCLETCNKKINLIGQNNEKITAIKRPGFYSSLFTNSPVSFQDQILKISNNISCFIIDKRFQ